MITFLIGFYLGVAIMSILSISRHHHPAERLGTYEQEGAE